MPFRQLPASTLRPAVRQHPGAQGRCGQAAHDVWDEGEFARRQLEPPTLRRRAREWGVVYAQRPGEPEEGSGDTPAPTPPVA